MILFGLFNIMFVAEDTYEITFQVISNIQNFVLFNEY